MDSEFAEKSSPQITTTSPFVYEKSYSQLTSSVSLAIFLISSLLFLIFLYLLIVGSDNFGLYLILFLLI
ncbi:MAG: hypothetical protein CVU81_03285, partial [Euryarchaeota archaeon HGW-Euryarchaeota-1]